MDRECLCIFTCILLFLLLNVLILNKNKLRLSHNLVHTGWGDFSLSSTTWVWSSSVSIFSKLNFVKVLASVAEGCLNHRCKQFLDLGSPHLMNKTPIELTSIWTNTIMWAFEKYSVMTYSWLNNDKYPVSSFLDLIASSVRSTFCVLPTLRVLVGANWGTDLEFLRTSVNWCLQVSTKYLINLGDHWAVRGGNVSNKVSKLYKTSRYMSFIEKQQYILEISATKCNQAW